MQAQHLLGSEDLLRYPGLPEPAKEVHDQSPLMKKLGPGPAPSTEMCDKPLSCLFGA